jgi:hypothetical protein
VVLLTLFWQKPANLPNTSVFEIQLLDESGDTVRTWPISPVRADYPPAEWRPGERLRGQHLLRLPAGLDSGEYQFILNGIALGRLTIQAPDRLFEQPEIETFINVPFSNSDGTPLATLIGATQSSSLSPHSSLTLVWRADAELPISYRVFVHLVDENSRIIAQSDGEPAEWARPTTGWAAGEYILDRHSLTLPDPLPDGPLTYRVGLYDPATGRRLPTPAADFAEIEGLGIGD